MNCTEARELLPLFIYGDLAAESANAVRVHLANCASCRAERAALAGVRAALTNVPAPPQVEIDARRLYADLLKATQRRTRGWQWAAMLVMGAAACLAFLLLATRLDLRVDQGQLVLRWRAHPAAVESSVLPESAGMANRNVEDQVLVLSRIIHVMASDSTRRDENHQRELTELQKRLNDLQRQMDRRFLDAEKDLRTLYKWQLVRNDTAASRAP